MSQAHIRITNPSGLEMFPLEQDTSHPAETKIELVHEGAAIDLTSMGFIQWPIKIEFNGDESFVLLKCPVVIHCGQSHK